MDGHARVLRVVAIGAPLVAAAVLASGTAAGYLLQALLGKLVYSTSNGAALMLCAAFALVVIAASRDRAGAITRGVAGDRIIAVSLAIPIVVGFAVGLMLAVEYFAAHGLAWNARVHHFDGRANSYTAFGHSHLAKPALGLALDALGLGPLVGAYDRGEAFGAERRGLLLVVGLAFAVAVAAASASALRVARRLAEAPMLVAAYVVAAVVAVKALVDGGVLAERVPSSLVVLALVAGAATREHVTVRLESWGYAALLVAALVEFGLAVALASDGQVPGIAAIAFTTAGYAFALGWHSPARGAAKTVLGLYVAAQICADLHGHYMPMVRSLEGAAAVTLDCGRFPVASTVRESGGRSAFAIYRAAGEDPRKPQRTLIAREGMDGARDLPVRLRILASSRDQVELAAEQGAVHLSFDPSAAVRVGDALELSARIVVADARLPPILPAAGSSAIERNNYWVAMHCVAERLRAAGIDEFQFVSSRRRD